MLRYRVKELGIFSTASDGLRFTRRLRNRRIRPILLARVGNYTMIIEIWHKQHFQIAELQRADLVDLWMNHGIKRAELQVPERKPCKELDPVTRIMSTNNVRSLLTQAIR